MVGITRRKVILSTAFPVKKCCRDILQLSFALPHPTVCVYVSLWLVGLTCPLILWINNDNSEKVCHNTKNNSSWGLLLRPPNDWTICAWRLIQLHARQVVIPANGTSRCQSLGHLTSCFTVGAVAFRPINANAAPATTTDAWWDRWKLDSYLSPKSRKDMRIMPVVNEKYLKTINKQTNKQRFDKRICNFCWIGIDQQNGGRFCAAPRLLDERTMKTMGSQMMLLPGWPQWHQWVNPANFPR